MLARTISSMIAISMQAPSGKPKIARKVHMHVHVNVRWK
jgi:hypothetical protein